VKVLDLHERGFQLWAGESRWLSIQEVCAGRWPESFASRTTKDAVKRDEDVQGTEKEKKLTLKRDKETPSPDARIRRRTQTV